MKDCCFWKQYFTVNVLDFFNGTHALTIRNSIVSHDDTRNTNQWSEARCLSDWLCDAWKIGEYIIFVNHAFVNLEHSFLALFHVCYT